MVPEEFHINGLLHILITGSSLFQLMVANHIQVMSNVGCLKVPYWDLFCSLFTLTIYMQQLSILKCSTLQMIPTFKSYVKSINKQINHDLKNLSNWLKANKITLNVGKPELVLFTSSKKQLDCDLKIKLNAKRLYETDSVKYLGIQINKRLTRKQQINHVALKLNKANAMLSKLRHALNIRTLTSVYYSIFESYLFYASLGWAQNTNSVKRLHLLQKKSPSIFFQSRNYHIGPLFKMS